MDNIAPTQASNRDPATWQRLVQWAWPRQETGWDNAIRVTLGLLFVLCSYWALRSIWYLVGVAIVRQNEHLPTQWLEPLFYQSALRFYDGDPLYGPPAVDFIAPIYGPGMGLAGGMMFHLMWPGYEPLRLMCLGFLLLLVAVAGLWAVRAGRSWWWFIFPPTLILALDQPLNRWLSQVNTDIPFLALTVLALYLLHDDRKPRARALIAGVCIAGASLFKQHGLVFAAGAFVPLAITRPKDALLFATGAALVLLPVFGWLQWESDGWFWKIAVQLPLESTVKDNPETLKKLRGLSDAGAMAFLIATAVLVVIEDRARGLLWAGTAAAAGYVTMKAYTKDGAGQNNFLPLLVVGMVMVTIAAIRLSQSMQTGRARLGIMAAMVAILGAVSLGSFDPVRDRYRDIQGSKAKGEDLPTGAYRDFEWSLREIVMNEPGRVFVGARPSLLWVEGREQNFHQTTLYEGTGRTSLYDLSSVVGGSLKRKYWKKMIVWDYGHEPFNKMLQKYYSKDKDLGKDPLIGMPVAVWVPKK